MFIRNAKTFKSIFLTILVCPYLVGSFMVQSGLLTDRSRSIRETIEHLSVIKGLQNESINIVSNNLNSDESTSKLIKILLLTPKLGKNFKYLNELQPNEYAWMIESERIDKNQNYQIIASDKNLNPWKLIRKKI